MLLSAARDFVRMQARSGTDTNLYTDALVDRALWLAASEFQRRIKYLRWVVDGGTVTPVTVNEVVVGRYSASQMLLPADLSGVVAYYGSRDLRPLRIVTEAALWTIVAQGINEYVAAVVDSDPTKMYVYPSGASTVRLVQTKRAVTAWTFGMTAGTNVVPAELPDEVWVGVASSGAPAELQAGDPEYVNQVAINGRAWEKFLLGWSGAR